MSDFFIPQSLVADYPVITVIYQVICIFIGFDHRYSKKPVGIFFLLPHSKMLCWVGTMVLFYVSTIHKLTPSVKCQATLLQ